MRSNFLDRMGSQLPYWPGNAERWVGEMAEIADALSIVHFPSSFHAAATDVFFFLTSSEFSKETRENFDVNCTDRDVARFCALLVMP